MGDSSTPASDAYGDAVYDLYDQTVDAYDYLATDVECARLFELASGGSVLELGVGTGRLAIPLAGMGLNVTGIDVSDAMLRVLEHKPGGDRVRSLKADMADLPTGAGSDYSLVYAIFQSFFCLLTQQQQTDCFAGVAQRLAPAGRFVIEGFVPPIAEFSNSHRMRLAGMGDDSINLTLSQHDPVRQRISSKLVFLTEGSIRVVPWEIRYAWPSELDLMAQMTGLALESRWQDWTGAPFTKTSTRHVSVYRQHQA
ncbi:class I SAM-dependent methyltransferase [Candidatus Nanopelagicales bacterium]|nr:class I SAM-dependent methyltransferase [Candidatus Nanopelagicales bacterium]